VKKITVCILLMLVFFMQSCKKTEDEESSIISDVQNTIDTYFKDLESLDNFTLVIDITFNLETYQMIIKREHHQSSFENDNMIEYYLIESNLCYVYFSHSEGFEKNEIDCKSYQNQPEFFFKTLKSEWFSKIDERYFLNLQNYKDIEPYFKVKFPQSSISNFEITFLNEMIHQMIFDVNVANEIYHFVMTLLLIDSTTVDLPDLT
jgi:hypothetical protein